MRFIYISFVTLLFSHFGQAQMVVDGDSLVGNEWVNFDQQYFKCKVHEDGLYRISASELIATGIDINQINGQDFQLYRLGEQVPLHTTNLSKFGEGDFIEFFGEKNRGELDKHHYPSEEDMLNPDYSLVTDTATYFLTWKSGSNNRRYTEIDNNLSGNLPDPLPYYMHSEEINFHDRHYKPTEQGTDYVKYSNLVTAEGFSSQISNNKTITIDADQIYANEDKASFRIRFGVNKVSHQLELDFNGTRYQDYNIANQYKVFNEVFAVSIGEIKERNTIQMVGRNGSGDRSLVSQVELIYPRKFDFKEQSTYRFDLENTGFRRYIEVRNFNAGNAPILYDLKNRTRRTVTVEEGLVKIGVEPRNASFDFYLVNQEADGAIKTVGDLKQVEWIDYGSQNHDFIIVTSERLFSDPENGGANWIQEYADYRASSQGGNYNPAIVTVEQLYDQFGYGIDRHFIAINNFANYVKKAWPSLEYFFVIGKGIEYPEYRTKAQQENVLTANYFVPAWGAPGADNLLFAEKGKNYAIRPVGRVAATSPAEVKIYLDKVKAHENNYDLPQTLEDKYWTKKIIHLSGGGNAGEQNLIASHLRNMENTVNKEKFGADVVTFRKNSADPLQTATSQQIIEQIDGGVSLITFFGHSAVGTFDFSLESPGEYQNANRLPMIMSLGCYSGNIHVPSRAKGLSEAFVLEPEVGAVAFAASSGTAYISSQGVLGNDFYKKFGQSMYGESIGKAMREMFISLSNRTSIGYVSLLQQMTYHGDPAIKFVDHASPDYLIDYSSIRTEPELITTADEVYDVFLDIVNIGSASPDSITVAVEHILPDGTVADTLYQRIKSPASKYTISVKFLNQGTQSVGENRIRVTVDSENEVEELPSPIAEANNTLDDGRGGNEYAYFISDNSAKPIYPREFGIATGTDIILKASTSNLFTPVQNYIFQIDTSALFENPLEEAVINSGGGLIEWKPTISLQQNVVYYWRITPEQENPVLGRIWEESSFIYLPNSSEGWNQSHYYQWLKNDLGSITIDSNRKFRFPSTNDEIRFNLGANTLQATWVEVNSVRWGSLNPRNKGNLFCIFTRNPYGAGFKNTTGEYGGVDVSIDVFAYDLSSAEDMINIKRVLEDIPVESTIFIYTLISNRNINFHTDKWDEYKNEVGYNLVDILESYGANQIGEFKNIGNAPYLYVFEKGKGLVHEEMGDNIESVVNHTAVTSKAFPEGVFKTISIKSASNWETLVYNVENLNDTDSVSLRIIGYDENDKIITDLHTREQELNLEEFNNNDIDRINLEFYFNSLDRQPPFIDFIRIFFKSAPEITFTNDNLLFYNDTLNQGEELVFKSNIRNLAEFSTDSLLVKFSLTDQKNETLEYFKKYERIEKDDPIEIGFTQSTASLHGKYQFFVEINPNEDQAEQFQFNNKGIKDFLVLADDSNPILNVTFDGIHIMNGEIVSAKPEIVISLSDENKFFILDDPKSFELKLQTNQDRNNIIDIPFNSPELEFIAATEDNNQAKLVYRPEFEDGFYTLFVQGKDVANNFSGDNGYSVEFRVVNKKSISNVFNYPNPFSTSTQFVFTLTGEVPNNIKLQIMTLTGKVVKEVTKEELGQLQVGINRTDYHWDGTDEYGDKLANGIYLYRLSTKNEDGSDYEKFNLNESSIDTDIFFKEGFGKMVIIR